MTACGFIAPSREVPVEDEMTERTFENGELY
jgi:hypothetical protein